MRPSAWVFGVGLGMLLAVLCGCGGPSTSSGKASQASDKKSEQMPKPPPSDPG